LAQVYPGAMELLERDWALAALVEGWDAAALGAGRVVVVTGEPGVGKTSLVSRFVRDLGAAARVLFGTCDDLLIPRPLGPLRDLAGTASAPLEQALSAGAAPHEIQSLLIAELELLPRPTVLVLEDVHWADDATLDLITVLGRRIGSLPALLVLTFRSGEVPPAHPLRAAVGGVAADDSMFIELAALSERAVASLAGHDAGEMYLATGGNPFYVTELLACRTDSDLPASIANAVMGRASRLGDEGRRLVELVSVVPGRVRTSVLDAAMPDWPAAAEEPERKQLLEVDTRYVRFRHELARNAIRSSLPIAGRRRLHAEILGALLAAGADPADIVHHAEAAGAEDVVADYALVAARRAAALESNRQAYSHYRRASGFVDRLPPIEQAPLLEELATAAYVVGRLEDAFPPIERAIAIFRELGDERGVGRCTRILSRLHWFVGDGDAAREKASEAIAMLEPLGDSVELARAYSGDSQLAMLAENAPEALRLGSRALALANRLHDESARAHALVNIGSAMAMVDHRDTATLLEAYEVADAAEDRNEATRALLNLGYAFMGWAKPEPALGYTGQALAYAQQHEVHTLASYAATVIAWLRLRAGEWDEAEHVTRSEVDRGITVPQLLAKTVSTELAVRRGDPDAAERLGELADQAERTGELQRMAPVLELAVECALTTGTPMPTERIEAAAEKIRSGSRPAGWGSARVAAWAAVAGIEIELDEPRSAPYAAMLRRDWRGAADAFGDIGWSYDRALMLSLQDDERALAGAIEIARALGAGPLTRRVAKRLRERGLSIPRGPRDSTRANPAGLTVRQLDVLALLATGLTNAEIAEQLFVSPRTAEHHVTAVLTKLGARTRRDAARRALELGLVETTNAVPVD
jgi:DNA-binding CsgD family transcriptional regulator/tetratricopeptide (TPR) repeat protein